MASSTGDYLQLLFDLFLKTPQTFSLQTSLIPPPTGWKHCPTFCAFCAFLRPNSFSAIPLNLSSEAT